MTTPIRRDDVLRVINQIPTGPDVGPVSSSGGISPAGGLDVSFDGLERILSLLERAGPLFDRFSERFMAIKDWEAKNGGGSAGFDMIDNSPASAAPPPPRAAPPAEAPMPGRNMDPMALYQILLGTLAQLPPTMTASEALEMAKMNKPIVLATIKEHLEELQG